MRSPKLLRKHSHSAAATGSRSGKSGEFLQKAAMRLGPSPTQLAQNRLVESIQASPYVVGQRVKTEFNSQHPDTRMVQRAADEEELQAKAKPAQLAAEEEDLQAKADPAQLKEEEELQGKFVTAQMQGLGEEELMQGKMATTQLEEGQTASEGNQTGLPDNLKNGIESL